MPRPQRIYGLMEVTWDTDGKPTVGAYRDETDEEKARRLHRKLPDKEGKDGNRS